MAKRKPGGRPSYISATKSERKRSHDAPGWDSYELGFWVLIGAVAIGYPIVRDATADRMARNTYANSESCACAYSDAQCTVSNGRWVGPWYAASSEDREASDPGEGRHCGSSYSGGTYIAGSGRNDGATPRTGVEKGYRGGFGATGRVRAAGS